MKSNTLAVNELRAISAQMITKAKSGHPGIALGAAPIIFSLYQNALKFDNSDPLYYNRDRFVMSAGHGSSLVYATLNLFDYNVTKEDLENFRQLNSKTPGHPERLMTPGVDCSTGPLGQGIANAVGMAIAEAHLAKVYNKENFKIIDNHIFCLTGDGCLMEGISYEALCLAGTLKLNNFTLIYDKNNITIEGDTKSNFDIDFNQYFKSLGFKVFEVKNGNDVNAISNALLKCKMQKVPTCLIVNTQIGYGSELAGSEKSHGSPLNENQLKNLMDNLQVNIEPFAFDITVKEYIKKTLQRNKEKINKEKELLAKYKELYQDDYNKLFEEQNLEEIIKNLSKLELKKSASRDTSHELLQYLAENVNNILGGCADLASSTRAFIENSGYISKDNLGERNIHFGIREHAMGAICNGIATYNIKPFASTFMSFSNYMFPAMRMAALDKAPVLYIFSHDSFMIGEDGPTHQAIEQLVSMRSIPNLQVFRPYNKEEMKAAFIHYLNNNLPTVISTTKNESKNVPSSVNDALRGGYILKPETKKLQAIIVASGLEVDTALEVSKLLENSKIDSRVVSMPNLMLFDSQTKNYTSRVIPPDFEKVVVIEPASSNGWFRVAGKKALYITKESFGKSAKAKDLVTEFGFDCESIVEKIKEFLKK